MTSFSIPKTMKGVIIEKTGGVEVLEYKTDIPVPEPKEGQILVKNDYIGINFIDTYYRTGLYPSPMPRILGSEAEGTIVALGPPPSSASASTTSTNPLTTHTHTDDPYLNFHPGDRVVWMATDAYAEYTAVPAEKAMLIPAGIAPTVAAAGMLQGLTALTLIREAHHVQAGEWTLVHAAAGGVGLWLCQLLHAVGARVIGTASTEAKMELARQNGAEFTINSKTENVVERVNAITGGVGVNVVFDGVGAATFEDDMKLLARKGTLASFGNASGAVPPFAISRLAEKNLKVLRPKLFNYIFTREEYERYAKELFGFMSEGMVQVHVHEIYPLEEVARAQTDLESRKTTGKLLLKP